MNTNRFYVIRLCAPALLFPFLPNVKKQFILESDCSDGFISVYLVVDKFKQIKAEIFYKIDSAIKRCIIVNKEHIINSSATNTTLSKTEMTNLAMILTKSKKLMKKAESIADKEYKKGDDLFVQCWMYNNLEHDDLSFTILDDEKFKVIPTNLEDQKHLFKSCINCILEHRLNLIADLEYALGNDVSLLTDPFISKNTQTINLSKG